MSIIGLTKKRAPKFDLRFVTEHSDYHIVYDASRPDNNFMTESVISMSTKNSMEDDSSAFTIVLAGDVDYSRVLNSNDLVILRLEPNEYNPARPSDKDRVQNNVLIVGLVSEVRVEGEYGDNQKMYRVTGQSLQKAFIQFELRTIQQVTATLNDVGWMDTSGDELGFSFELQGSTIAQAARLIYNRFTEYMRYDFTGEGVTNNAIRDRLATRFTSWEDDEMLANPLTFTTYEGSLNQLFQDIINKPFCEMFFDTYSDQEDKERSVFIIRRTPFEKLDWDNLHRHEVRTEDVIEENLGRNDLEAYSLYNVVPGDMDEEVALLSSRPYFNEELVHKYGYSMLEVTHQFLSTLNILEDSAPDIESLSEKEQEEYLEKNSTIAKYSRMLYRWYANNPNFFSGELKVSGHPDYRLGNRLLYRDPYNKDLWEFYIESVEHEFSYSAGYTTTLGVTRGLKIKNEDDDGGRFKLPMGPPKLFSGGYLGEMSLQAVKEHANKNSGPVNEYNASVGGGITFPVMPKDGTVVTSPYGMRTHPTKGGRRMHTGIDLAGGGTNIVSMADGVVTKTVRGSTGYGYYVIVEHGTMNGKKISTLYAHLAEIRVSTGQQVKAGQSLGVMGTTGTSTGVHLHFEVHENGSHVNPRGYINP